MCLETDINLKILIFQIKNSKAEIIIWINIAK